MNIQFLICYVHSGTFVYTFVGLYFVLIKKDSQASSKKYKGRAPVCVSHVKDASSDAAQRLYAVTSGSRGLALCHL